MNNQATPAVEVERHSATALRFATGDLAQAQYVDAKHLDAALARIAERDALLSEIVEQVGPTVITKRQYLEQGDGCTNIMQEINGPDWLDKAGKLLGFDAFLAAGEKPAIQHQTAPAQLRFPTMLRKMWSGGEVQQWLEEQGPLYRHPLVTQGDSATLQEVYDLFGTGAQARTPSTLLTCLGNMKRFSDYLHAVEREFLMVPGEPSEEPEDEGCEPDDECLVNCWGANSTEHYVEQFRAALAQLADKGVAAQAIVNAGRVAHLYSSGGGMLAWIEQERSTLALSAKKAPGAKE